MLEALYERTVNAHNIGSWGSAHYLGEEYARIRSLLEKHLSKEQFEFISQIEKVDFSNYFNNYELEKAQKAYIMGVATACDIGLSFLKSLEMNLDKELAKQKVEFSLKEKELQLKEREVEHMQKLLCLFPHIVLHFLCHSL